jgi:hypothetical protein
VLSRAILPWVQEPVDSATAYVRNGVTSEAHERNGGAKSRGRPYGGRFMQLTKGLEARVGAQVKQAGPVASPSLPNGLISAEVGQSAGRLSFHLRLSESPQVAPAQSLIAW